MHNDLTSESTQTPPPPAGAKAKEKFQPTFDQAYAYFAYRLPEERMPKRHVVKVHCPFHGDKQPSMTVNLAKGVWNCFAGCGGGGMLAFERKLMGTDTETAWAEIYRITGMERVVPNYQKRTIEAEYDYLNTDGTLAFQVVRYQDPKGFRQRHRDSKGDWEWNLKGVTLVPFNSPALTTSNLALITEGEKNSRDVEKAAVHFPDEDGALRYAATTSPMGAGKWRDEFGPYFAGKKCFVFQDADGVGRKHALQVCANVYKYAQRVHLVELPAGYHDVSDYLKEHSPEELFALMCATPAWTPQPDAMKPQSITAPTGFDLVGIGELLSRPDVPPDYLVDELLIRGTVSAAVAKPKVGKSTFARGLCLAVSKGTNFLGRSTRRGSCIYLALEERVEEITADFRAMGADGSEPIEVHAAPAPEAAVPALIELLRKLRPALVVIDPLFRLARIRDEKAYAEVYAALGPFIDAAREMNVHILMTHHSGKSMKADAIDSPLGSTAIGGAVATLVVLSKKESYRTIQTVTRIGKPIPETILSFDEKTRLLSLGGTKEEADRTQVETEICAYLKDREEGMPQPDIDNHVEGKTRIKRNALKNLFEKKLVKRTGGGKKGDPFIYLFPCSTGIAETREQASANEAQPLVNADEKLVPKIEQNEMLVPENSDGETGAVAYASTASAKVPANGQPENSIDPEDGAWV